MTVHLFSGAGALVGSLMVGPRVERLGDNFRDVTLPGHSLPLTAIGAMFVIIGMVGKVSGLSENTGHVTVNTLVGGAAGCLVTMNLFKLKTRRGKKYSMALDNVQKSVTLTNRKWSFLTAFNGFYTGTISVCGVGQELPAWGAFIAGIVGGLSFFLMSGLLRLNKVDDPVHGIGVQLSGGVVGTLVVGLCNVAMTHDGAKIGWELVGLAVVAAWSCACFLIVLMPLLLCGKLRVKDCQEKAGIDSVKMKEPAYENSTPAPSDACPSRLTNLPRDGFLTPTTVTRSGNMTCQLSAINKKSHLHCSRCSGLDVDGVSPRTVIELPSPGGLIQMSVPPPPPYPTSTMKKTDSTLVVPEVTITSSCISENDSEAPLINSMSSSLGMRDLKKNLRKQKEQLRKTTSKYKCSNDDDDVNSSIDSDGSVESVKSSVVRNVVSLANNRDNFNYLTATTPSKKRENQELRGANTTNEDEINDTEIDITKYLKSPINKDDISEENASNSVVETLDVAVTKAKDGGKMFEASINFVSDDESDFDEKLI